METAKKTIWWVEHLRLDTLWAMFQRSRHERLDVKQVNYLYRPNRLVLAMAKFLVKGDVRWYEYDLSAHDHDDGEALHFHNVRETTEFADSLMTHPDLKALTHKIDAEFDRDAIELYLKRCYEMDGWQNLGLIRLAEWHQRESQGKERHVVLTRGKGIDPFIQKYAEDRDVMAMTYHEQNEWGMSLVRLVYLLFKLMKFQVSGWLLSSRVKSNRTFDPKIAVFYAQGVHVDRRSDLFWLKPSNIDPKNVLYYLLSKKYPLTQDLAKQFEAVGVDFISLLPSKYMRAKNDEHRMLRFSREHVRSIKSVLRELFRLIPHVFQKPFYLRIYQFEKLVWLFDHIALYEALFRSQNVKVHYALLSENDQNMMAIHIAEKRTNVADVYSHWSHYPSPMNFPAHDIFFSWGPHFRPMIGKKGHQIKYMLYSGYPYDYAFPNAKQRGWEIRKKLDPAKVRFVLSFFDNAYFEGGWFKRRDIEEFFFRLLNEVRNHSRWGLVIKSKRPETEKAVFSERTSLLIKDLQAEHRMEICDTNIFPAFAACASDLAIGWGSFNTPATEAALAGVPAICFDCGFERSHFLNQRYLNQLTFNDAGLMFSAIEKFADGQRDGDFANMKAALRDIDPYQDGRAAERIGKCIHALYQFMRNGSDREDALKAAVRIFQEANGSGMVVENQQDRNPETVQV